MDDETTLALYDQRRARARALSDELVGTTGRTAILAAGQRLGIVQKGVFVFDTQEETAILSDASIFELHDANGENAAQRLARGRRYPEDSRAQEVLDAFCRARFSLFSLSEPSPGVSITATDEVTGQVVRVVDRGLSMFPSPMIATRLVHFPEFAITTGAGIPIPTQGIFKGLTRALVARQIYLEALRAPDAPEKLRGDFFFATMAHLLRAGMLRSTRFIDPTDPGEVAAVEADELRGSLMSPRPQLPVTRSGLKVGRNDPCPCGSGKKYKKCHGG